MSGRTFHVAESLLYEQFIHGRSRLPKSEAEILNILKLLQDTQGIGHFATVSQVWIPTSDR